MRGFVGKITAQHGNQKPRLLPKISGLPINNSTMVTNVWEEFLRIQDSNSLAQEGAFSLFEGCEWFTVNWDGVGKIRMHGKKF